MKVHTILVLTVLLLVTPLTVQSQDSLEQSLSRLKQEIAKREEIDRDQSMPEDLKAQNRLVLEKRRAELVTATRNAPYQKYLDSLGNLATPGEKDYVQNSLRKVSLTANVTNAVPVSANNAPNPPPPPLQVSGVVTLQNDQFYERKSDGSRGLKTAYSSKTNVPLKGAAVVIETINSDGAREAVARTITDKNGKYSVTLSAAGDYIISASVEDFKVEEPVTVPANGSVTQDLELLVRPLGEYSRAIVGFEQAAASSADSVQKFFFDLTLSAPLPIGTVDPYFGRRARLWGTGRITSVPQQINSGVAAFATNFAQQVGELKVNEVAQGIEYLVGTEVRLTGRMAPFGSFDGVSTNRFSLSFIAAAGATTPINPKATLEVFKVFPGAPGLPEVPAGKDFIAFVSPDRDRFFRQYYGGLRLQTYYFNYRNPDIPMKRYPAVLDITFGQNEAVTGGRLRGGVLRVEGFYPLPYESMKFINIFGTALMKLTRTNITDPLILERAPDGTTVPAANVFLHTVPQINRDYYRIGVGIDFISLINKLRSAPQ